MLFSLMSGGYSSHRSKESYAFDCASIPSSASPPSGIFTTPSTSPETFTITDSMLTLNTVISGFSYIFLFILQDLFN